MLFYLKCLSSLEYYLLVYYYCSSIDIILNWQDNEPYVFHFDPLFYQVYFVLNLILFIDLKFKEITFLYSLNSDFFEIMMEILME
jgi:hypothetical protein